MRKTFPILLIVLGVAVVLGLVLAPQLGRSVSNTPTTVKAQEQTTPETQRQVTVQGRAAVEAVPNTAVVRLGVVTQAATATLALDRNSQQVSVVLARIKELAIAEQDIQTNAFWVSPLYNRDEQEPVTPQTAPEITGYRVTNTLEVVVSDLSNLGAVLGAAVEAGANQVYGVELRVDNAATLREQAQADAFRDAQSQAQQIAQAVGATLGPAVTIDTTTNMAPPVSMTAIGDRASGAVPVQAGSEAIEVSIRVTFALEPPQNTP